MEPNPAPRHRKPPDNHGFKVIRLRELPASFPSCDCPEQIYSYWMANIATAAWYTPDVE